MNGLLGEIPQLPQQPQPSMFERMRQMLAQQQQHPQGNDALQGLWLQDAERMALGEIPQVDRDTWLQQKRMELMQQQQAQTQPVLR